MSHKVTIEECRQIAGQKNGKCLSGIYINYKAKLKWQCAEGHIWEATLHSVKSRGSWCLQCLLLSKRLTIDEMRSLAEKKGGKCLSDAYANNFTKLKWQCAKGHIWEAKPTNIASGEWCPECNRDGQRISLEQMKDLAEEHGGKCLSDKYVSRSNSLIWECSKGHVWETAPKVVFAGSWCPVCAKERIKGKAIYPHIWTIEDMQYLAKAHNGRCLSYTYKNTHTRLLWKCAKGHAWETEPQQIILGRWCPHCYGNARGTIEKMYELAKSHEGTCLSKEYTNQRTKLRWCCAKGHVWESMPKSIKEGHWCARCANSHPK